jgi:hypothetical protein
VASPRRSDNSTITSNGIGGNNRIYPNVGTVPTPAGSDTHDKGQQ